MKKTFTRHSMYIAAVCVFLGTIALIIGCNDPFSPSSGYTPPDGMGFVRLSLAPTSARTILPTDFTAAVYRLTFTATSGGPAPADPIWRTHSEFTAPINLFPGDYTLEVVAFRTAGTPPSGEFASFTTGAGAITIAIGPTGTTQAVALTVIPPNIATPGGNGTFAWDIEFDITSGTTFTTQQMIITPVSGSSAVHTVTFSIPDTSDSSHSLPEGYYFVDIIMTTDGTTVSRREVLHVYRFLESKLTYEFTDAHFGIAGSGTLNLGTPSVNPIPNVTPTVNATGLASGAVEIERGDTLTFTVTNATSDYTGGTIQWFHGSDFSAPFETGATCDVDTSATPFDTTGVNVDDIVHYLTVVGTTAAGIPGATVIQIKVVDQ